MPKIGDIHLMKISEISSLLMPKFSNIINSLYDFRYNNCEMSSEFSLGRTSETLSIELRKESEFSINQDLTYLEKSLISFILNMRLNKISEKDIRKFLQSEIELSIILSRKLFQCQ